MLKALGILGAGGLLLLLLNGCETRPDEQVQKAAPEKARTFVYTCGDGLEFVARTEGETAWLFLPSGTLKLDKISTDSYRAGAVTFSITGETALLAGPEESYPDCRNDRRRAIWEHAKLSGADYRAIGNEPGWHLEIREQSRLILVTDYGSQRYDFELPEPQIDPTARVTSYQVKQAGQELFLTISGKSCSDSMSGEQFESSVEVVLNGKTLRGCGRALH